MAAGGRDSTAAVCHHAKDGGPHSLTTYQVYSAVAYCTELDSAVAGLSPLCSLLRIGAAACLILQQELDPSPLSLSICTLGAWGGGVNEATVRGAKASL